jgi:cell volume regulation protein A
VDPEPWAAGIRLTEEPDGLRRHTVEPGSAADGRTIAELNLGDSGWISMVSRNGRLIQIRNGTRLKAGDTVLTLGDANAQIGELFGERPSPGDT